MKISDLTFDQLFDAIANAEKLKTLLDQLRSAERDANAEAVRVRAQIIAERKTAQDECDRVIEETKNQVRGMFEEAARKQARADNALAAAAERHNEAKRVEGENARERNELDRQQRQLAKDQATLKADQEKVARQLAAFDESRSRIAAA